MAAAHDLKLCGVIRVGSSPTPGTRSLNPAQLKRTVEAKLDNLYRVYQQKHQRSAEVTPFKRLTPRLVTKYIVEQEPLRLPT